MEQDLLVPIVSRFVHSQSNCLIRKGSLHQVVSVTPDVVIRGEHRISILWLVCTYMTLYPSTKPAMDPPGKTLCIWPTWTPEIK